MTTPIPDGCAVIDDFIVEMDQCLLVGYANLSPAQQTTLDQMQAIFAGTPLSEPIHTALDMIRKGVFRPEDFCAIAAARAALQGAQYDHLRNAAQTILGRTASSSADDQPALAPPTPILAGTAHWLTDIAIHGFSRLETNALAAFDTTLAQLQSDPSMLPLATLLTGFVDELTGAVPVTDKNAALLFRWGDLWSKSLLMTTHMIETQPSQLVSGTFYPMGIEWRSQKRLVSVVFYGILKTEPMAYWTRFTFSAYKVDAIQRGEGWLLFPQAERLLTALHEGKSLLLDGVPMLPTGDLLWDDDIPVGGTYNLMEVALQYLSPDAAEPIHLPPVPSHKRHPVHLAEPVALANYRLKNQHLTSGDLNVPLDLRRILNTELSPKHLAKYDHLVGLLRYDDQQWQLQPLAAGNRKQISTLLDLGETLKMLRKLPDDSTVAILQERATRLLREH
jgi:hypothetical protein